MPSIAPELLAPGLPVLALGNAAASLCETLGGNVEESVVQNRVETVDFQPGVITKGLDSDERMLHTVFPLTLPEDAFPIARVNDKIIAFRSGFFGVGFQLETNDVDGAPCLTILPKTYAGVPVHGQKAYSLPMPKRNAQKIVLKVRRPFVLDRWT